ncbi:MAG: hypothetical protein H6Q17_2216 [Bacteroidetes bacterium]|nr:hypothetical protein [Bacteroidota bacterium]
MIIVVLYSLKIREELSAKQKLESQLILSLQICQVESRSGQFVKDFSAKTMSLFIFLLLHITCRRYENVAEFVDCVLSAYYNKPKRANLPKASNFSAFFYSGCCVP